MYTVINQYIPPTDLIHQFEALVEGKTQVAFQIYQTHPQQLGAVAGLLIYVPEAEPVFAA